MGTHPIFESDFDCLTDSPNSDQILNNEGSSPLSRSHRCRGRHLLRQVPQGHRHWSPRHPCQGLPSLEGRDEVHLGEIHHDREVARIIARQGRCPHRVLPHLQHEQGRHSWLPLQAPCSLCPFPHQLHRCHLKGAEGRVVRQWQRHRGRLQVGGAHPAVDHCQEKSSSYHQLALQLLLCRRVTTRGTTIDGV